MLTNENTRTQLIKMKAIDPAAEFFKFLLTSEEVGVEKPHRRMFEMALKNLKLPPDRCLVIGDSYETDVQPARRLGIHSWLSREFAEKTVTFRLPSTVRVLKSLDQLTSLLSL